MLELTRHVAERVADRPWIDCADGRTRSKLHHRLVGGRRRRCQRPPRRDGAGPTPAYRRDDRPARSAIRTTTSKPSSASRTQPPSHSRATTPAREGSPPSERAGRRPARSEQSSRSASTRAAPRTSRSGRKVARCCGTSELPSLPAADDDLPSQLDHLRQKFTGLVTPVVGARRGRGPPRRRRTTRSWHLDPPVARARPIRTLSGSRVQDGRSTITTPRYVPPRSSQLVEPDPGVGCGRP